MGITLIFASILVKKWENRKNISVLSCKKSNPEKIAHFPQKNAKNDAIICNII